MTLSELVREVADRIGRLPAPTNGQVRAVPDERTVRYYAALGLLDRPAQMNGRTALYSAIHVAQIVAIKRLQHAGKSLAEISAMWGELDAATLERMSGVALPGSVARTPTTRQFWKTVGSPTQSDMQPPPQAQLQPQLRSQPQPLPAAELRITLAPNVSLVVALGDGHSGVTSADLRALQLAAAPLLAELANRGLTPQSGGN